MYIATNSENVLIVTSNTYEKVSNGIKLDNAIYPPVLNLTFYKDVDVPEGVTPRKYCYTIADGFYENENYVPYIPPEQLTDQRLSDLESAIANILGGGA